MTKTQAAPKFVISMPLFQFAYANRLKWNEDGAWENINGFIVHFEGDNSGILKFSILLDTSLLIKSDIDDILIKAKNGDKVELIEIQNEFVGLRCNSYSAIKNDTILSILKELTDFFLKKGINPIIKDITSYKPLTVDEFNHLRKISYVLIPRFVLSLLYIVIIFFSYNLNPPTNGTYENALIKLFIASMLVLGGAFIFYLVLKIKKGLVWYLFSGDTYYGKSKSLMIHGLIIGICTLVFFVYECFKYYRVTF